ncbi:MAG: VWA domain-containing protein [Nannocystaceae bacterium]|nr:VWA domain-containing protein [Nannocystaceae bacterium]
MKGSRMNTALTAARGMVTRLRDRDTVSVVAYAQDAELVVAPTTLTPSSRAAVLRALSTISARGNTCISCGLEQALALAPRGDGAVHRIVLLSDGKANRGGRTLADFAGIAQQARRSQTAVTSIGVGVDYDQRLLASLSRGTNGAHHFVERLSQLAPIFEQELQALAQSVAASTTVEVQLAPGVELLEVVDRASSRDGQRLIVPFGSFSAGEDKTLLMRVRLPPREHGVQAVGDIALRYTDASTGRRERADATLEVTVGDTKSELVPTVVARIAQSETVRDIGAINALIDAGRDDAASNAIKRSRKRIRKRRDESLARGLKPGSAAADSFAFQDAALGKAGLNVEQAREAQVQGDRDAPATRKAASKRSEALASPFD